jgi:hypothetical protein
VPVRLNLAQSSQCSSLRPRSWFLLTGKRKQTLLTSRARQTRKYMIPLQNTNKEIPHSFTTLNYIPHEPTYSPGSWGAQEHLYSSEILLSMQKRSKPCLLSSLPFPIIRHYFWRIHDVRLWLPRVMLDTITLPGNLIVGFGVPSAPNGDVQESTPPHTRERLPFQLEAVGVVPDRLPCTAQEAIHETQDGHASRDSFLTCTLRVPQPARLQMDQSIWGEACETFCYASD